MIFWGFTKIWIARFLYTSIIEPAVQKLLTAKFCQLVLQKVSCFIRDVWQRLKYTSTCFRMFLLPTFEKAFFFLGNRRCCASPKKTAYHRGKLIRSYYDLTCLIHFYCLRNGKWYILVTLGLFRILWKSSNVTVQEELWEEREGKKYMIINELPWKVSLG